MSLFINGVRIPKSVEHEGPGAIAAYLADHMEPGPDPGPDENLDAPEGDEEVGDDE